MEAVRARSRRTLGLVLTLAMAAVAAGAADGRFKDRGDRFEGIRPANVGGGDFELLGVHVEPSPRDRRAATLHLSFPLAVAAELRVRVWEPEAGYWMVPHRRRFGPQQVFSWPRGAALEPAGVDVRRLHVLATDLEETVYFPARLTTASQAGPVSGYVFRFRSRGGVELAGMIAREVAGRLQPLQEIRREEDFGGVLAFTWDGRGEGGAAAPAGVYHLALRGTVFLTRDRKLAIDVPFHHHGPLAP